MALSQFNIYFSYLNNNINKNNNIKINTITYIM